MKVQVSVGDGVPQLKRELESLPSRQRAERLRSLAVMGLIFEQSSGMKLENAPAMNGHAQRDTETESVKDAAKGRIKKLKF